MILVLLGTQDKPFDRLVNEIDRLVNKKVIKDDVVMQLGFTKFKSKNIKTFDLIESDKLNEYISEADLIITHGGVGSILSGLKQNKIIIAVPRVKEYGEHTNDHQIQIVNEFFNTGYILKCDNPNELEIALKDASKFKPKKYVSNTKKMVNMIENYIDNL